METEVLKLYNSGMPQQKIAEKLKVTRMVVRTILYKAGLKGKKSNKDYLGKNHGSWTGTGDISGRQWYQIQHAAKIRGLAFDIDIDYAWNLFIQQDGKCALTGLPLEHKVSTKSKGNASLDRIDSKKGYQKGNLQWVHKDVNKMKNDLDQEYFISLCHRISSSAPMSLYPK